MRNPSRISDLNAQQVIACHPHKRNFREIVVLPDYEAPVLQLVAQLPHHDSGFWCIWSELQRRRSDKPVPLWVTYPAPVVAIAFDKWQKRQAEVAELSGGKMGPSPWCRVGGTVEPRGINPQNQKHLGIIRYNITTVIK